MSHAHPSKVTPVAHALISKCQLVNRETSEQRVAEYRDQLLTLQEEEYIKCGRPEGSPWQVWFREVAQSTPTPSAPSDPNAFSGLSLHDFHDPRTRNILLKKGAEFVPDNIFFRTVDTGRALPMKLADFRIQWYAHKNHWDHVDRMKKQKKEGNWEMYAFAIIVCSNDSHLSMSAYFALFFVFHCFFSFTNLLSFVICMIRWAATYR